MKAIKIISISVLLSFVLCFITFSYLELTFNIFEWEYMVRENAMLIFWALGIVFTLMQLMIELSNKNIKTND